jgi:hypothetical protein
MKTVPKGIQGWILILAVVLVAIAPRAFGKGPFDIPASLDLNAIADAQPNPPSESPSTPASDPSTILPLADSLILNPAPLRDLRHEHFHWRAALRETFEFDTVMHLERLNNTDTLPDSGRGNFFVDYIRSVEGLHGWDDHDRFIIQYIQHSFQGASDARIELQNNPYGRNIEWGDPGYWHSRLVSMAWNGFWGAQFKIGLYSEAMIGNVGLPNKYRKKPLPPDADYGLMAWSEFVVNPAFGTCWGIGEDLIDRYVVRKVQRSGHEYLFYAARSFLTPSRSWANLLRFKVPWNRDTPSEMDDPLR